MSFYHVLPCPFCGASVGKKCRGPTGKVLATYIHTARKLAVRRAHLKRPSIEDLKACPLAVRYRWRP